MYEDPLIWSFKEGQSQHCRQFLAALPLRDWIPCLQSSHKSTEDLWEAAWHEPPTAETFLSQRRSAEQSSSQREERGIVSRIASIPSLLRKSASHHIVSVIRVSLFCGRGDQATVVSLSNCHRSHITAQEYKLFMR